MNVGILYKVLFAMILLIAVSGCTQESQITTTTISTSATLPSTIIIGTTTSSTFMPLPQEKCLPETPDSCNQECETDDDCVYTNCIYHICINKEEEIEELCGSDDNPCPVCGVFSCQCIDNKCEVV